MRLTLTGVTVALAAIAAPALAAPSSSSSSSSSHGGNSSSINVKHGGTVPKGSGPINVTDERAVKARVKELWAEIEKYKPVEHAEIEKEYRDFKDHEWKMLTNSITQRPHQIDFERTTTNSSSLPPEFLWGYASAAAQVEGAVKADGRGPSIWDYFAHRSDGMQNNDTFDVATNFRYMYPLDIKRMAESGARIYSFSISWSRVLPLGKGYVSQEGLQFYKDLVKEIHHNGMKAAVTLQHWDLPLYLQIAEDGLQSAKYVDAFAEYAELIFKQLGPMGIDHWISHNEPQTMCQQRYLLALAGVYGYKKAPPASRWLCSGYTIKAHGRMSELMHQYQASGHVKKGSVLSFKNSGSLSANWDPNSKEDQEAGERGIEFSLGIFSDPVYKDSHDYPEMIKKEVPTSWLPELTSADKKRLENSSHFFAQDWYSSSIVQSLPAAEFQACKGNTSHPDWPNCAGTNMTMSDGWPLGTETPDLSCDWMTNTPGMLRDHLKYVQNRWPTPKGIIITEIGWPERDEANKTNLWDIVQDSGRQKYYLDQFNQVVESVNTDGIKVMGAWLWSATPNVEWEVGRLPRFGTSSINYTDPILPRTYMGSSYVVRDFFKKHINGN